ncbi:MAG TPA: hypothetical protein VKV39_06245 [Candidatus Sulfotelmatobacter sp.]|nr:hypothetical protein [Candidatus Sulfotelmatobacter sp.]
MNLEANHAAPDSHTATVASPLPSEALSEDLALGLLKNRDLCADDVEQIAKNAAVMKSRKVRLGIAAHPNAPRRIALRLVRELYTFDLLHFSLSSGAASDLRRLAEEILMTRITSLALGERISLARRCTARVAGVLLLDKESRVWQTALTNPRLTETAVTGAIQRPTATAAVVEAICHHSRWCLRPEVRVALLRNPHTPLARAVEFARRIPQSQLKDILQSSRLPEKVRSYLLHDLQLRKK